MQWIQPSTSSGIQIHFLNDVMRAHESVLQAFVLRGGLKLLVKWTRHMAAAASYSQEVSFRLHLSAAKDTVQDADLLAWP